MLLKSFYAWVVYHLKSADFWRSLCSTFFYVLWLIFLGFNFWAPWSTAGWYENREVMTSALDAHCAFVYPRMSRLSPIPLYSVSLPQFGTQLEKSTLFHLFSQVCMSKKIRFICWLIIRRGVRRVLPNTKLSDIIKGKEPIQRLAILGF